MTDPTDAPAIPEGMRGCENDPRIEAAPSTLPPATGHGGSDEQVALDLLIEHFAAWGVPLTHDISVPTRRAMLAFAREAAPLTASAGDVEVLRWRPEVRAFADLMEWQLRANDHKPGWKDDCPSDLLDRLREETAELADADIRLGKQIGWGDAALYLDHTRADVGREAADVANFAMMIADVCGALPTPQQATVEAGEGA